MWDQIDHCLLATFLKLIHTAVVNPLPCQQAFQAPHKTIGNEKHIINCILVLWGLLLFLIPTVALIDVLGGKSPIVRATLHSEAAARQQHRHGNVSAMRREEWSSRKTNAVQP